MPGARKRRGMHVVLALVASTLPFAAVEVGLRLAGLYPDQVPVRFVNGLERNAALGESVLRPSDTLFWDLQPGSLEPNGGDLINDEGFRGPRIPRERVDGALRVALVGDSCTYGTGVEYPRTWGALLEERLEEAGREVEILNAGVPGYTLFQAARRFEEAVLPFGPDLVILYLPAWNDFSAAMVAPDEELAAEPDRMGGAGLASLRVVRMLRSWVNGALPGRDEVIAAGLAGKPLRGLRVEPDAFARILGEFLDTCGDAGAEVAVVLPALNATYAEKLPTYFERSQLYHGILRGAAEDRGLPTVDLVELYPRSRHGELYSDVVHPSYIGSLWLAVALSETVWEQGWSPRRQARPAGPGAVVVTCAPGRAVGSSQVRLTVDVEAPADWGGARVRIVPTSTPYPLNPFAVDPDPPPVFVRDAVSDRLEGALGQIATRFEQETRARFEVVIPPGLLDDTRTLGFAARLELGERELYGAPDWILIDP